MAPTQNWFPGTRAGQLAMAKNWCGILTVQGTAWGVPEAVVTGLGMAATEADGIPAAAMNETTRTPVVTARCREVFGKLEDMMRDIKRRYFLSPPLQDADFIALGLRPVDTHPSPTGRLEAQIRVEPFLVARHELGLRLVYESGNPDAPANKEYRIWYQVVGPPDAIPQSPTDLHSSFSTKRKKEMMDFGPDSSGKTVYFAVQIENGNLKGPWGPLTSALIP